MGLFNFGKKKEEQGTNDSGKKIETGCACGNKCGISDVKTVKFIVLGACCKKSSDTFINVKNAVAELGFEDEVINIGDFIEIAKYGVMQTPAFVINGKVVSYGKLISTEEAKEFIEKFELTKGE